MLLTDDNIIHAAAFNEVVVSVDHLSVVEVDLSVEVNTLLNRSTSCT
jgi:hypothetical protein